MRAVLRQGVHLLVVLFCVTLFVALLTSMLPGDPVNAIAGFGTDAQKEQIRERLGLDDPIPVQYVRWVGEPSLRL